MVDRDEAVRLSIAERLEEHGVDDTEDRRVGADAQTEREDDDRREARALDESTDGIPEIAHDEDSGRLVGECSALAIYFDTMSVTSV